MKLEPPSELEKNLGTPETPYCDARQKLRE